LAEPTGVLVAEGKKTAKIETDLADEDNLETNTMLAPYRELSSKPVGARSAAGKKELKSLAARLLAQQLPEVRESPTVKKLNQLLVSAYQPRDLPCI